MAASTSQNNVASCSQPPNTRAKTSFLPEDLIENIIQFLPFKQLCGLSILSRRFRQTWRSCRNLSFDRDFARNLSRDEYRDIVNNVLHEYTCADTFKLYYDTTDTDLVSSWICRAVALGIKELELDFTPASRESFFLDYDLIEVESIRTLKLVNCDIEVPLKPNGGLRHLREITLQNVMGWSHTVDAIFVNCIFLREMRLIKCNYIYSINASGQHLRSLVVEGCLNVDWITINAPSLRTFHYHGKITKFNFRCDLPHLNDVILDIAPPRGFQLLSRRNAVMIGLANVEILTVTSTFLEGLSARFEEYEYREMNFSLLKLKEFHLIVAPESFIDPSDVAKFLQKCPRTERVFIDLGKHAFADSLYWENYGRECLGESQIILPFLRHVKIKGFTMKELQESMARYFLKNAINLERLIIVKARIHYFSKSYSVECLRGGIMSNARIEIYNHRRDTSTIMPEYSRDV